MGELREDQNETINSRLEEQEPAGLPEWEPAPGALQKRYTQAEKDKEALRRAQREPQPVIKKRAAGKKVVQGKVDTDSLIVKMKEQIRVIQHVSEVNVEIDPEGLSAKAREVLIQLQKAVETAKEVAIQSIQAI